jgi:hypothetical protein
VFHGIGAAVLFFGVDEKRGREANKVTEGNRIKSRIGGVDTSRDVE